MADCAPVAIAFAGRTSEAGADVARGTVNRASGPRGFAWAVEGFAPRCDSTPDNVTLPGLRAAPDGTDDGRAPAAGGTAVAADRGTAAPFVSVVAAKKELSGFAPASPQPRAGALRGPFVLAGLEGATAAASLLAAADACAAPARAFPPSVKASGDGEGGLPAARGTAVAPKNLDVADRVERATKSL